MRVNNGCEISGGDTAPNGVMERSMPAPLPHTDEASCGSPLARELAPWGSVTDWWREGGREGVEEDSREESVLEVVWGHREAKPNVTSDLNPSRGFQNVRVCGCLSACECVFTCDCACLCVCLLWWAYTYIPLHRLLTEGISQTCCLRNVFHEQNILTAIHFCRGFCLGFFDIPKISHCFCQLNGVQINHTTTKDYLGGKCTLSFCITWIKVTKKLL